VAKENSKPAGNPGIGRAVHEDVRWAARDLKHSGVAFLAAAGVDPSEIARRAGHASLAFTYDRYGHLLPEVDKQAATKLEAVRAATRLA
jgi:integrase